MVSGQRFRSKVATRLGPAALRSEENIDVAYGIYVYVVEAPNIGNKIGKLALIK